MPNPSGSDLWLTERVAAVAEGETDEAQGDAEAATDDEAIETVAPAQIRLPVKLEGNQSVLVYVAETDPSAELSIEWVQDRKTPWAGPLLVGGGVLALIGALLYLLAVDHDRRGLGPRRGRKGPLLGIRNVFSAARKTRSSGKTQENDGEQTGSSDASQTGSAEGASSTDTKRMSRQVTRAVAGASLGLTVMVGVSACAPSYWPDFSPAVTEATTEAQPELETATVAPVPVTQGQLEQILDNIAELSAAADSSLDESGLDVRFTGDALAERKANYTIRRAVSDYDVVVPGITSEMLGYQLVQSTESWPRTVFIVVASTTGDTSSEDDAAEGAEAEAAESPSLAIIMTQTNPHANFLVSRTIALRGGITMPEAAPAEEGTARLASDIKTLVMMPQDVGPSYAAILAGGTGVEQAEFFDLEGDTLLERSGLAWVNQSAAAAQTAGQGITYSVSAAKSDSRIISLSTGVGGALVATTIHETRVEQPEEGGRWRPTVPPSLAALSGLEGQQDKLVSVVSHQLLFYVPSAIDGGEIELLGYTSDLIAASNS